MRKACDNGGRDKERSNKEKNTHEHNSVSSVFCGQLDIFDTSDAFDDDRDTRRTSSDPSDVIPAQVCVDVRRWRRNVSRADNN